MSCYLAKVEAWAVGDIIPVATAQLKLTSRRPSMAKFKAEKWLRERMEKEGYQNLDRRFDFVAKVIWQGKSFVHCVDFRVDPTLEKTL